jgi:2-polyprenyl-3-methyl-5-hydroxy-6-metoxy-1,4-benzoquinol methylase
VPGPSASDAAGELAARIEPFDSYWQAPKNVEKGYRAFAQYYRYNFLPHLPTDKTSRILVVSCGPGYLVNLLAERGYRNVLGIDSDPAKVEHARKRGLDCRVERAFAFLEKRADEYEAIGSEQELNHLTIDEMILFLQLCRPALRSNGTLVVYGLNGANPLVGAENLAHNIDHFNTFTEYSLTQVLEIAGFEQIRLHPLKLYVFWKNPLNYVGLVATTVFSLVFRATYALYGKSVKIMTKKIAATARKAA